VSEPRGGEAAGRAAAERAAGLCASCGHARTQRSARGGIFWRCARAESDPRFLRYPPLPVTRCSGHEAG
jgi:hypothetical protein